MRLPERSESPSADARSSLEAPADFCRRHVGPTDGDIADMLGTLGVDSLGALVAETVPETIRLQETLDLPAPLSESRALDELRSKMSGNEVLRSFLGMGYHDCVTPGVILRNMLENPGWYTQYTPYQAEIAQGRLEALLNFQTMVADLTGLPLANASLLDEATAAAEAMTLCRAVAGRGRDGFFVAEDCHPQTIAVVRTRAEPLGIRAPRRVPRGARTSRAQRLFGRARPVPGHGRRSAGSFRISPRRPTRPGPSSWWPPTCWP